jgi:sugar phosphate isomerase/epimerase
VPALRTAIELASLRLPLKKALEKAAQLGASAVALDARHGLDTTELSQTGIRQLRKMLDDLNLRVSAVAFPTRRGYNIQEQLDARIEATRRAMRLTADLGARVLVNRVGEIPASDDELPGSLLVEVLEDLGRTGQKCGVWLAADTGFDSGEDLARLLAVVSEGSLAVNLNPGLLTVHGHSPSEAVELLGNHIQHVFANDAVRDLAQGRGIEVQLGRGSVDYPAVLGALEERAYSGYFTIVRREAADPAMEIGQSIEYLGNI